MKLLLARCLLLGDRGPARTLPGACISVSALTPHRQSTAMTQAPIRADVHQALNVHLDALAEIALDFTFSLEDGANPAQILFAQILDARIDVHFRFVQNRERPRTANSVDIRKPNFCPLVWRKIYTCDTSHFLIR